MVRRPIKKRWILLAASVIAVVIMAVLHAIAPRMLRREVESQLVSAFGGEVEIESVALGTRWHEAHDVRLIGAVSGQPWMTIDRVRFELPLSEAIAGRVTPDRIMLDGLEIAVRLDQRGRLVEPALQLPKPTGAKLPNVAISNARVRVEQTGRTSVVFDSISATVSSNDNTVTVMGRVGESPVGVVSGQATYDVKNAALQGEVASERFSFNTNNLAKLPAIGALAHSPIGQARAMTKGKVSFAIGKHRPLTYRADLQVWDAEIGGPENVLQLTKGEGRVVLADGVATLSRCRGDIAGGNIDADGTLDLRPNGDGGRLHIGLAGVRLPLRSRSERLLPGLAGVLSGRVNVAAQREQARWVLRGTGSAELDDAVWDGLPLDTLTASLDLKEWQLPAAGNESVVIGLLQLDYSMPHADLGRLVTQLSHGDDSVVHHVTGDVSLQGTLDIPLETANTPTSFRASAKVRSDEFAIAGVKYGPLSANATLRRGHIEFEQATLQLRPSGHVAVAGNLAVMVPGDSRFRLDLEDLSTQAAAHYFQSLEPLHGDINGALELVIPQSRWDAPAWWQLTGKVQSEVLRWGDMALTQVSLGVSMDRGVVQLQEARCQWKDSQFKGSGVLALAAPYRFDVRASAPRLVLAQLIETTGLDPPVSLQGVARSDLHCSGTLEPRRWTAKGTVTAGGLKLGDTSVDRVTLPWQVDSKNLTIDEAKGEVFGGTIHVSVVVPLHDIASSRLDGYFESWNMDALSRNLARESFVLKGIGKGRFSAEGFFGSLDERKAELQVSGIDAVISNVPFRQLAGRMIVRRDTATFQVDGRTLDGTCSFQGKARLDASDWTPRQIQSKASLDQFRLQTLWSAIGQQQRFGLLHAVGDVELDIELEDWKGPAVLKGSMKLAQVRWGNRTLTESLSANVNASDGELRIEDIRVRIERGEIVSNAVVNLTNGRGEFRLQLHQVPIRGLLALAPKIARQVRGNVDGELIGVLGDRWNAAGMLRVDRATVAGIPLTAVRLPVRISRVPESGRTRLDITWQAGRIASGKAKGRCQFFWSGRSSIVASGELKSADLRPIAKAVPDISDLLGGRVSAKFSVKSKNTRSLEDLAAQFDIQVQQSQTLRLPGVRRLTTALGVPSPGAVTFDRTIVQGDIQRGVVRIKQMTLESHEARLWIDGQMDLRGTMDFNVTADTGPLSAVNLAASAVNPVALLRRRLLFFQLGGSLRHPTVQVRTDQFVAQEAIFFFLPVVSLR